VWYLSPSVKVSDVGWLGTIGSGAGMLLRDCVGERVGGRPHLRVGARMLVRSSARRRSAASSIWKWPMRTLFGFGFGSGALPGYTSISFTTQSPSVPVVATFSDTSIGPAIVRFSISGAV